MRVVCRQEVRTERENAMKERSPCFMKAKKREENVHPISEVFRLVRPVGMVVVELEFNHVQVS